MAKSNGKRTMLISCMVAIGLGLLLFVFHSVRKLGLQMNEIGASSFGERVIHMGDGRSIYLKHEARGQNFDVVSVSENPNVCDSASAEADLIFKYDANPLTISQSENDLIIFWAWGFSQPKHPLVHVLVKNVRPDSLSSEDKASMKVQQIDIPLEFEKVKDGDCKRK